VNIKTVVRFGVGSVGSALLGLLTLPVVTWLFSVGDVGRFALLQVALNFSMLVFTLGLDQAYVREYHEWENKGELLRTTFLPPFLLFLTLVFVAIWVPGSISNFLFESDQWLLGYLALIAISTGLIFRFSLMVLRMEERGLAFSTGQILPKLILLILVLGYWIGDLSTGLGYLVGSYAVSFVLTIAVLILVIRKHVSGMLKANIDWTKFKAILSYSLPLVLGTAAFWGLTAVDKLFLRGLSSFEQLGIYSVAVSFAAAATILQSVFSTLWAPMVYKWLNSNTGVELSRVHDVVRQVVIVISLIFAFAGSFSWLLDFILPDQYNNVKFLVLCCLSFPLFYTLSETTVIGIGISRRSSFSMYSSLLAFGLNCVLNYFFIPIYGATAAAVSSAIAFWLFLFMRTEFSMYVWKPMPRLTIYSLSSLSLAGVIGSVIFGPDYPLMVHGLWFVLLVGLIVLFRTDLTQFFRYLSLEMSKKTVNSELT
jgi:O-antigen/teichoic acid export membrane protein